MGWDVAIEGQIALEDARAVTALKKAPFTAAPALATAPAPFHLAIHVPPATVGDAIDALTDRAFTFAGRGGRLALSGVWDEDSFRDRGATLASVLSLAAGRGATGEVKLVALSGPALAFRLTLAPDGLEVVQLPERAHAQLANAPWVADVMERAASVLGAPPEPEAASARGPIEEALATLATLDDATLFAAAADLPPRVSVRIKGRPVDQAWVVPTEAYPDGASLRAALFAKPKKGRKPAGDDWRAAFALPALARHDAAQAEPLAIAILASDASDELRQSAAHALGHAATDAAIDALFAALGTRALAGFALGRNAHPAIVARAIAALDDAAVQALYAPSPIPGAYIASRPGELVLLLQAKRSPAAAPRLLEVWRQRGRSSAAQLVGSAIVSIGAPGGLAEVAQAMGELEVSVAKVAARAFLAIDPATAFERSERLFASTSPTDLRAAATLLGALTPDAALDPRWLALARAVPAQSPVHRAAAWLLERAKGG